MDILENYEKQNPQPAIRQAPYQNAAPQESFLIRAVIKLSGGKIQDRRQILMILLIFAGVAFLAAVFLIFQSTGVIQHPIINAPSPGTVSTGSAAQ